MWDTVKRSVSGTSALINWWAYANLLRSCKEWIIDSRLPWRQTFIRMAILEALNLLTRNTLIVLDSTVFVDQSIWICRKSYWLWYIIRSGRFIIGTSRISVTALQRRFEAALVDRSIAIITSDGRRVAALDEAEHFLCALHVLLYLLHVIFCWG